MDDGGGLFSAINTVTYALTEPVFATFRNVLPRPGDLPIDLAPAVVILGLGLIRALLGC